MLDVWKEKLYIHFGIVCGFQYSLGEHVTSAQVYRHSVHSVEITNKMQPCNRIYYSTVH